MIVDDDKTSLTLYERLLVREGHQVSTRDRAFGTAPAIMKARPDIVLLDVHMPGLDGTEIVRVFRERGEGERPLLLLFSHQALADVQQAAMACGADGALVKGADPKEFLVGFRTLVVQHLSRRNSAPTSDGF